MPDDHDERQGKRQHDEPSSDSDALDESEQSAESENEPKGKADRREDPDARNVGG